MISPFTTAHDGVKSPNRSGLFEVEDYSFDIEQILAIGSQSSGAGAGKVTFNPFSITRKIDCASPIFFQMACSGTAFKMVGLGMRKSAGGEATGAMFLTFTFKLVAVKTISWAHDDEAPKETVTFEYGGLIVKYCQQQPNGKLLPAIPGGWNRVRNVRDTEVKDEIK
jgi:type VI secretion system secreted protein Hcp